MVGYSCLWPKGHKLGELLNYCEMGGLLGWPQRLEHLPLQTAPISKCNGVLALLQGGARGSRSIVVKPSSNHGGTGRYSRVVPLLLSAQVKHLHLSSSLLRWRSLSRLLSLNLGVPALVNPLGNHSGTRRQRLPRPKPQYSVNPLRCSKLCLRNVVYLFPALRHLTHSFGLLRTSLVVLPNKVDTPRPEWAPSCRCEVWAFVPFLHVCVDL